MRTKFNMINKQEVIEKLDEIEFYPEIKNQLEIHLKNAILSKDHDFIKVLLKAGANPNPSEGLNCHLGYLLHEYGVEKTTKGELIFSIIELLLKFDANPNRVYMNNWRAYDYAVALGSIPKIVELLEKYGADKEQRVKV